MGRCIPRLYAAASLKLYTIASVPNDILSYSAALCRGLIEATSYKLWWLVGILYSAALCRGLIEAPTKRRDTRGNWRIPRLYAAASLKRHVVTSLRYDSISIPRLYAAASLKQRGRVRLSDGVPAVFRGFMPRPH